MRKFISTAIALTLGSVTAPAIAANWEYQGTAVTGEEVYLDLDSIQPDRRGYFFNYRIGRDLITAYTPCNGEWQVIDRNGGGRFMQPQSPATRNMLNRVCNSAATNWEYLGEAVGGQAVYLDLSSIRLVQQGSYVFDYRLGQELRRATTACDGTWRVADARGNFGAAQRPQSPATRTMLSRVCNAGR
ncbi:MAG: hypothetical protein OHK0037_31720 [Elainellaceae cyanobacterium]